MTEQRNDTLNPKILPEEERKVEASLRPARLEEFVGQARIKERLSLFIQAAQGRSEHLDHVLFSGPPGLGKPDLVRLRGASTTRPRARVDRKRRRLFAIRKRSAAFTAGADSQRCSGTVSTPVKPRRSRDQRENARAQDGGSGHAHAPRLVCQSALPSVGWPMI